MTSMDLEEGEIDICCEVSMLSSFVASPREGHLQQVFHIFWLLESTPQRSTHAGSIIPCYKQEAFFRHDWPKFYGEEKEAIPSNASTRFSLDFVIRAFVDADHAGNWVTNGSRTRLINFVNSATIHWVS